MDFIHVRNLEKYHPKYQDRELLWCKLYFSILNGDPEFEMLDEIAQWRFVKFIMLELQTKKGIPLDEEYLKRKGFNLKKQPISLTLQMLHKFISIVTGETENPCKEDIKREENIKREEEIYVDFEKSTLTLWNSFCDKHPNLKKLQSITETRRTHLKTRFEQETFRAFDKILSAIEEQPFLLNGNSDSKDHKNWRVNFDWLISNDTNHVKVLEKQYLDKKSNKWGF